VFQAYLTTFLIEPGHEEPIRTIGEMLKSEKKFGLFERDKIYLYPSTSDPVDSAIVKNSVQCADGPTCFLWAAVYHNISTIIHDLTMNMYRATGDWTDESNRPLLCEIEGGVFRTFHFAMRVKKGSHLLKLIDDVLSHVFEGGIFMHIKEMSFDKLKMDSKLDVPTFGDTYHDISIGQLLTAFYLLMLGYILAVACFSIEIMWHRYRSKGRGPTGTCLGHGQT
jgi:hypothetical protein